MRRWWRRTDESDRDENEKRPERSEGAGGQDPGRPAFPTMWGRDPFEELFGRNWGMGAFGGEFDRMHGEFERMHREMDELMARALSGEVPPPEEGGPVVYGFSMRTGPDGRPEFREFGNTRLARPGVPGSPSGTCRLPGGQAEKDYMYREPMTDLFEEGDVVSIVAEMPGVEKDNIELEIAGDRVKIHVDTPTRKYEKTLGLSCQVKPDTAKATYKNGVLEVRIEKDIPPEKKGTRVNIE